MTVKVGDSIKVSASSPSILPGRMHARVAGSNSFSEWCTKFPYITEHIEISPCAAVSSSPNRYTRMFQSRRRGVHSRNAVELQNFRRRLGDEMENLRQVISEMSLPVAKLKPIWSSPERNLLVHKLNALRYLFTRYRIARMKELLQYYTPISESVKLGLSVIGSDDFPPEDQILEIRHTFYEVDPPEGTAAERQMKSTSALLAHLEREVASWEQPEWVKMGLRPLLDSGTERARRFRGVSGSYFPPGLVEDDIARYLFVFDDNLRAQVDGALKDGNVGERALGLALGLIPDDYASPKIAAQILFRVIFSHAYELGVVYCSQSDGSAHKFADLARASATCTQWPTFIHLPAEDLTTEAFVKRLQPLVTAWASFSSAWLTPCPWDAGEWIVDGLRKVQASAQVFFALSTGTDLDKMRTAVSSCLPFDDMFTLLIAIFASWHGPDLVWLRSFLKLLPSQFVDQDLEFALANVESLITQLI